MAVTARQLPASRAQVEYRRILIPFEGERPGGVATACALAADHGAVVTALAVIEVPAALPLDADMPEPLDALTVAEAIGDQRGVRVERRVVRARLAGEAIVATAEELESELIVLRSAPGAKTARYVLKHARCRVLLSVASP